MNRYLSLAACIAALACAGCATLPPLKNYTLPNTHKVSFATCYYNVNFAFTPTEVSQTHFPKAIQEKNAYLIENMRKTLSKHGYQVAMIGCKEPFKADNKTIRVVLSPFMFPAPAHEVLVEVYLVPPFWKKNVPAIVQITYGPLHQSVEKSFQEIPPVLFQKIAEGEAANKASDIPNASGMNTLSHRTNAAGTP